MPQVSAFPEAGWTNVTYSAGFGLPMPGVKINHTEWQQHSSGLAVVPQQRCPESCNGRGLCGQVVSKDGSKQQEGEEQYRCLCAFVSGCEGACDRPQCCWRGSSCCIAGSGRD
jgi:hypothetical protein